MPKRTKADENGRNTEWLIWTDGSAAPGAHGAYGAVAVQLSRKPNGAKATGTVKALGGRRRQGSSNRMELTAAVMALRAMPTNGRATVITDSRFLADHVQGDLPGWERDGFRHTRSGRAIEFAELWRDLSREMARLEWVRWRWTPAHNGDPANATADWLARRSRKDELAGDQEFGKLPKDRRAEIIRHAETTANTEPARTEGQRRPGEGTPKGTDRQSRARKNGTDASGPTMVGLTVGEARALLGGCPKGTRVDLTLRRAGA